jgi:Flp pilus assembly protein TadG
MKTISMLPTWLRMRRSAAALLADCHGVAATEFAVIVPIMLVMFFGTVEFSSGVAVSRKVTLLARTLSDLTSQLTSVDDAKVTNFFTASGAILTPYPATPTQATLSELYVDPTTHKARVQWSKSATINAAGVVTLVAGRAVSSTVVVPAALAVDGTYLIYSEVSYLYTPTIGYVMAKTGVNLADTAFTRPRQSVCVPYGSPTTPCTTL